MRWLVNPVMVRFGIGTTLLVRGRRTDKLVEVPLGRLLALDGVRFLVSGGGNTRWVRNFRSAARAALRANRGSEEFRAVELGGAERCRIVAAKRQRLAHRGDWYFELLLGNGARTKAALKS